MIISSGYNIAGPEVEEALLRPPGRASSAPSSARPTRTAASVVSAFVVLRDGRRRRRRRRPRELQDFVKAQIAPYKYPRGVDFVDALPQTPTGKLQRFKLRDEQAAALKRPVRIAVIGGGPGGLYFAALAKQLDPHHEITVWERNAPDDTFGFGVVFSDETLGGIEHADAEIHQRDGAASSPAGTTSTSHFRGQVVTSGGHGFAAMSRKRLLRDPAGSAAPSSASTVHFRTEAPDADDAAATHDLVVAADGLNSAVRSRYADVVPARASTCARCKYMWLGTDRVFDAFTVLHRARRRTA